MTATRTETPYSLDSVRQDAGIAVVVASRPASATIVRNRRTTLSGWAVDGPGQRAADAVYVRLDGKLATSCQVGIARADVAAAYKISAYTMSGFSCTIAANRITTGRHAIELDIVAQSGHSYYAVASPTALVVR